MTPDFWVGVIVASLTWLVIYALAVIACAWREAGFRAAEMGNTEAANDRTILTRKECLGGDRLGYLGPREARAYLSPDDAKIYFSLSGAADRLEFARSRVRA